MIMHKKNRKIKTSRVICLSLFATEAAVLILCFITEASLWVDTTAMTILYAKIFVGVCILSLLLLSLMVSIFFKKLSLDKKILILLGLLAIGLGILGISGLVFKNEMSFIDAIYKSLQLFVGEFGEVSFKVGTFPLLLNISRFLALFVTFGAIIILLLREKLFYLTIRLFYKDVIIISDSLDQRINSMVEKFSNEGRKVLVGITGSQNDSDSTLNGEIPVIYLKTEKQNFSGLTHCNIKKAKCIYLLCSKTSVNLAIFRQIQKFLPVSKNQHPDEIRESSNKMVSINPQDLFFQFLNMLKNHIISQDLSMSQTSLKITCYIQYQTDTERDFYSMDEYLVKRSSHLETYFINYSDSAIRQLLSKVLLKNIAGLCKTDTSNTLMRKMENIKIGVAGSGQLLERTIFEISRIFVFNDCVPIELYVLDHKDSLKLENNLLNLIKINYVTSAELQENCSAINMLFISSSNDTEILSLLRSFFQHNLHEKIGEILVLSENNQTEYKILQKFIASMTHPFRNNMLSESSSVIRLSNTVDLTFSIDEFYTKFGPTVREIHKAYQSAFSNGKMIDFNKLPENLTESNLLSSLHTNIILEYLIDLVRNSISLDYSLIEFFAAAEHERWFNERYLQNFIYSEHNNHLLKKNSFLVHWDDLSESKKTSNINYVIESLIRMLQRSTDGLTIEFLPLISEYKFNSINEESSNEI